MFRTDGRIIEARGNGMGPCNLPIFILQDIAERPLQNSLSSPAKSGGVLTQGHSSATRLNSYHADLRVSQKLVE